LFSLHQRSTIQSKINFITLSVNNLDESVEFYQKAFEFKISDINKALCVFALNDDFYLAIQERNIFSLQSGENSLDVKFSGFILSHIVNSVKEVDDIIDRMISFGCIITERLDEKWGYYVSFRDINGHCWEIANHKN